MNPTIRFIRIILQGSITLLLFCGDPPSEAPVQKMDARIFFASIPPVADIYVDDVYTGKTNIAEIDACSGEHNITFKKDSLQYDTIMTFTVGKNPTVMVRFDTK